MKTTLTESQKANLRDTIMEIYGECIVSDYNIRMRKSIIKDILKSVQENEPLVYLYLTYYRSKRIQLYKMLSAIVSRCQLKPDYKEHYGNDIFCAYDYMSSIYKK